MKHQVDLPLLLPHIPDARDRCVHRLGSSLRAREGVKDVHVIGAGAGAGADAPARLCVHYDPGLLSLTRIEALARQLGAELTGRFGHVDLPAPGLDNPRHARAIVAKLERLPGVEDVAVTAAGTLRAAFDREALNEQAIRDAIGDRESHGEHGDSRAELILALASGALLGAGLLLQALADPGPVIEALPFAASGICGGLFATKEAWESLRARRFEIDFLMLVAAAGAAAMGAWAEGALLLFLFSLGHALEHYAMRRARRAIESLADLAPSTALRRRGEEVVEVPVDELRPGDTVVVRPDGRIPADGLVVLGESSVDEAPITGESVPVDKVAWAGDPEAAPRSARVFAGTINGSGLVEIRVSRAAGDTTLARVVQMVRDAETHRSPTQRLTDRFERIFVPAVLALVVALLFAWVVLDEGFAESFYRAMAVLVAASPCALAIATPSAVLSGVARAGRSGVLVKGGGPLENLGTLRAIAFDKTGTLTRGKPKVTDLRPSEGVSEEDLLRIAAAVEASSDHPLAAAVVDAAEARLEQKTLPAVDDVRSLTGYGISASVEGAEVHVGKASLFDDLLGAPLPEALRAQVADLQRRGQTTVLVRHGGRFLGAVGLMDAPRASAASVIRRLHELGIRRTVMLSGDNSAVVRAVAGEVGIDDARGDLLPEDKVRVIQEIREEFGKVAMVGDGVNDAPAMAHATVSIAMGAAGSDVALETADVALMADDLSRLPFAVGLSRSTSRIIRENLWVSLGVVALLIPATLSGLGIGPAVALHEGSTVVVVFNALRLLAYRER